MDLALAMLGGALLVAGFVFCVVPLVSGPALAYAALWTLYFTSAGVPAWMLVAGGVMLASVTVLDYLVPAIGAKKFNCSRWGVFGCLVGTIAGLFFLPVGLVAGPFAGAVVGELVAGRSLAPAFRGGIGALLGFLCGTLLKFVACFAMAAMFAVRLYRLM